MSKIPFFNFVILDLHKHRSRDIGVFFISTAFVTLLCSFLFLSSSLQYSLKNALVNEGDFIIQKFRGGHNIDIEKESLKKIEKIRGVYKAKGRVYGRYHLLNSSYFITIWGIDSDEKILSGLTQQDQLEDNTMLISPSFQKYMQKHYFKEYYHFFSPEGKKIKVKTEALLPKNSFISLSDIVITNSNTARDIIGTKEDYFSDITVFVPNKSELDTIKYKLKSLFFDALVIDKRDLINSYENFFNFKSGIFLLLYMIVIFTFMLLLYQRFTVANSSQKRDVAILKMVGWSVGDIIKLKLTQSLMIGVLAFVIGVILAYIYVYYLNAPFLSQIFLGFNGLPKEYIFYPYINKLLLFEIFLLFIIPYLLSQLVPIWKIAITDPTEAVK